MRIPEYIPKLKDQELMDFMTDVRNILNNGGYIAQVGTAAPTATGDTGQTVLSQVGLQYSSWSYLNNAWREVPLDAARGWGYLTIAGGGPAYQIGSVTFAREFKVAPMVLVSYIGAKTSGAAPTALTDITAANTLRIAIAYAVTTTGFTVAIYTGNGSAMTDGHHECFGYYAVAT